MSFVELGGSPRESLNESSGSSAERRFLVPFNQRITFAQAIVGTAYPNFPQSRVIAIDIQPFSDDLIATNAIPDISIASADYGSKPCLATVKYGPDYTQKTWPTGLTKPSPIRFGTELRYQIQGAGQFLLMPVSSLKWEDDDTLDPPSPVPEGINSATLVNLKTIQIQWDFVDNPPIAGLDSLLGRVNDATFLGCPAETLLLENYDITESFRASPLVPHTNRVTLNFKQRQIIEGSDIYGWNHDYREDPAGWVKLLRSDDEPRYKLDTFTTMFA